MEDLAKHLASVGHEVTVLTTFPSHPHGQVYPGYRSRAYSIQEWRSIRILRTWSYITTKKSALARLLNQLSFLFSSSLLGLFFLRGRVNVIVGVCPPLFVGLTARVIGWRKRAPYIADLQDIWPAEAVAVGMLRNRFVISLAEWLETYVYSGAYRIVTITDGCRRDIGNKTASDSKIKVIENWVDTDLFRPLEKTHVAGIPEGRFIVGFVGTMGLAQGLDSVVHCAKVIESKGENVQFLFIGEGVEKARIIEQAKQTRLRNITFLPAQQRESLPRYLASCDVCLVNLRDERIFDIIVPSKTYEYLACGKPVIMAVDGDARKLVEDWECGVWSQPGNSQMLADCILDLAHDAPRRLRISKKARSVAEENFSMKRLTVAYNKIITEAAETFPDPDL